jgi:DNA-directed RNA polymerase alpha subunit
MTGKLFLSELLDLIKEAKLNQEVYIKSGSSYFPVDDIKLDDDKGLIIISDAIEPQTNY